MIILAIAHGVVCEQARTVATSMPSWEVLVDAAPDGVVLVDDHGRIAKVNAQLERMLQRSRSELVGEPIEVLLPMGRRWHHETDRLAWFAQPQHFTSRIGEALRGNNTTVPVEIAVAPLEFEGHIWALAHIREASERRGVDARTVFLSLHDALTGISNRAAFDQTLSRLSVQGPWPIAVMMIDLDGLKAINDEFGHIAGDAHLKAAAELLHRTFRSTDLVARIGGDEFVVIASGRNAASLSVLEQRLAGALAEYNAHHPLPLNWSVGSAIAQQGESLRTALQTADARMYAQKRLHHHTPLPQPMPES